MIYAGYDLANFIYPNANVWPQSLQGKNIIIFDNIFVREDYEIDNGIIISEGTTLSHDI